MVEWLQQLFNIASLPGHLSYAVLALSYLLTNIVWLRVTAIVAMVLEMVYFSLSGSAMAAGIVWDFVFVIINLVMLWLLLRARRRVASEAPSADALFLERILTGLDRAQIGRLLQAGRMVEGSRAIACSRANSRLPRCPSSWQAWPRRPCRMDKSAALVRAH